MAEIPYTPVPQVQAREATNVQVAAPAATAQAFGQASALAFQQLGGDVSKIGEIANKHALEMQRDLNETDANNQLMDAEVKIGEVKMKMHSLNGKAAADYLPEAQDSILKIRQEALKNATNPAVGRMLDQQLVRRAGFSVMDLAQYAGTQSKAARVASQEAIVETGKKTGIGAAEDEFAHTLETVKKTSTEAYKAKGLDGPALDAAVSKDVSEMYSNRIIARGMTDPYGAKKYLEAHKAEIDGDVYLNTMVKLDQRAIVVDAKEIADQATEGDYFKNLRRQESGGDDSAKNPNSSASGRFQFTKDTFEQTLKEHPELGLTMADWKDPQAQEKAVRAFTKDNAEALKAGGEAANQSNLYMTHFMGRQGGPAFIKAMKDNPTAIAAEKFPEAAAANRSVFYDKDGNPRTLAQVFAKQTAGFSGPGRADFTEKSVDEAVAAARTEAEIRWPGNTQVADQAESRVRSNFGRAQRADEQYQRQTYQAMFARTMGMDNGGKAPTTVDELLGENQELHDAYFRLDPTRQEAINKRLEHNAKGVEYPTNPDTLGRYRTLLGMAENQPDEFQKMKLIDEQIPDGMIKSLIEKQVKGGAEKGEKLGLTTAMGVLRTAGFLEGVTPSNDPDKYNQITGALVESLKKFQEINKRPPTDDEVLKMGSSLFADVQVPGRFWGTTKKEALEVKSPEVLGREAAIGALPVAKQVEKLYGIPASATAAIDARLRSVRGKAPTAAEIAQIWQQSPGLRAIYSNVENN